MNSLNQLLSERDYGRTTFAGTVDEPATVTVNGRSAKVLSTDGGAPFKFEALVDLDAGANTVVVEAKDGQNNTTTKTYSVTTNGTSKRYEYDVKIPRFRGHPEWREDARGVFDGEATDKTSKASVQAGVQG